MLRRTAASLGLLSVIREELAKVPGYLSHRTQEAAGLHVQSAGKAIDFLKGESPGETPEMREKRLKHKEMYDAIMKETQAKAAALREAERAATADLRAKLPWVQKVKAAMSDARAAVQSMVSQRSATMALLQHCTASHAAEVAVEQGIDVKNVHMVIEQQQKPWSVEYESVVVGYIDAPAVSEEEVMVFAEKLQRACPVANSMHIQWRQDTRGEDYLREQQQRQEQNPSSVDFGTFSRDGMASFGKDGAAAERGGDTAAAAAGDRDRDSVHTPAGMPGSRRRSSPRCRGGSFSSSSYGNNDDGLGRGGGFGGDDEFHPPLVKRHWKPDGGRR